MAAARSALSPQESCPSAWRLPTTAVVSTHAQPWRASSPGPARPRPRPRPVPSPCMPGLAPALDGVAQSPTQHLLSPRSARDAALASSGCRDRVCACVCMRSVGRTGPGVPGPPLTGSFALCRQSRLEALLRHRVPVRGSAEPGGLGGEPVTPAFPSTPPILGWHGAEPSVRVPE